MEMSCGDLGKGQLFEYNAFSEAELDSKIEQCPMEICRQVYGPGSTDLTGIGALMSLGIQLILAVLYWIIILLYKAKFLFSQNQQVQQRISMLRSRERNTPLSLVAWFSRHHQSCLWSQLLFTSAISLAGLVRHVQRDDDFIGVYESFSILGFVAVSFLSLLLTTISYYGTVDRNRLFTVGLIVTFCWGTIAETSPLWLARTENILRSCKKYADRTNAPWKYGAIAPFNTSWLVMNFSVILSIPTLLSAWLWLRHLHKQRSSSGLEIVNVEMMERNHRFVQSMEDPVGYLSPRSITHKWIRHLYCIRKAWAKWAFHALYILVVLLSSYLVYMAIVSFCNMLVVRQSMNILLADKTEQNIWGIGQIVAPFVWVHLFIDMAYSAAADIQKLKLIRQGRSSSNSEHANQSSDFEAGSTL